MSKIKDFYEDLKYERGSSNKKVANFYRMVSAVFIAGPIVQLLLLVLMIINTALYGFNPASIMACGVIIFLTIIEVVLVQVTKDK